MSIILALLAVKSMLAWWLNLSPNTSLYLSSRPDFNKYRGSEWVNIVLRRFLHNHGNIASEESPKSGLCVILSKDFKGFV